MSIYKSFKLSYLKGFICYFKKHNNINPMVIQDLISREVLMVGYSDIEGIYISLESGYVICFSRTKHCLWIKGESSGYIIAVYRFCLDCDKDSILIGSLIKEVVCHLGNYSCFCSE